MQKNLNKKGFTLVELLIASSILMLIISMSLSIFFNATRLNAYVELTDKLHFESRYALERIAREIQGGTIDYPEYYNYYVLNGSGQQFQGSDNLGSNYSVYGARFYNPGDDAYSLGSQGVNTGGLPVLTLNSDDLGTWCQNPSGVDPIDHSDCIGYPSLEATEDFATGTNPYTGSFPTSPLQASAICDSTSEMFTYANRDCSFTSTVDAHEVDMLFLISADGETKTIITTEPWAQGFLGSGDVVSMLKLTGTDNDSDGIRESWICADGFACQGPGPLPVITSSEIEDLNVPGINIVEAYQDFAPISPYDLDITDLRFYIAPIEDPMKAYDEALEQIQPYVTIIMTAELIDPRVAQLPVSQRSITLQTTVSTQFYGEIQSYLSE